MVQYDVCNALGENTCDHLTYQGSYVLQHSRRPLKSLQDTTI